MFTDPTKLITVFRSWALQLIVLKRMIQECQILLYSTCTIDGLSTIKDVQLTINRWSGVDAELDLKPLKQLNNASKLLLNNRQFISLVDLQICISFQCWVMYAHEILTRCIEMIQLHPRFDSQLAIVKQEEASRNTIQAIEFQTFMSSKNT